MIQATSQILHDGARNVVMQFTGLCDGNGGNETNAVKVDVSELVPPPVLVRVLRIEYNVLGGILQLLWGDSGAGGPVTFLNLEGHSDTDYHNIGGMKNGATDTRTGDILFTTLGFEAGSSYSIKLDMVKSGAP